MNCNGACSTFVIQHLMSVSLVEQAEILEFVWLFIDLGFFTFGFGAGGGGGGVVPSCPAPPPPRPGFMGAPSMKLACCCCTSLRPPMKTGLSRVESEPHVHSVLKCMPPVRISKSSPTCWGWDRVEGPLHGSMKAILNQTGFC